MQHRQKSTLILIESEYFSFPEIPGISGLFSVSRPISDAPGTGHFSFIRFSDVFVRFGFAGIFPEFVGIMGRFIGL